MEEKIKEFYELQYKTQKEISWEQLHLYFLSKMQEIKMKNDTSGKDCEDDHYNADELLCALLSILGFEDIIKVWDDIDKWYA